jgi:hypothetical protein
MHEVAEPEARDLNPKDNSGTTSNQGKEVIPEKPLDLKT